MLMPAAVLIVILLGSIAVDFAVVFLGQRDLGAAAAAAANNAATYGLDEAAFRAGEGYQFQADQVDGGGAVGARRPAASATTMSRPPSRSTASRSSSA